MFSKNIRLKLIVAMLLMMVLSAVVLNAECDMMAMIAKKGHNIAWIESTTTDWNEPEDYFQFLYDCNWNDDGYGIIYYDTENVLPAISYPNIIGDNPIQFNDTSNQAWYLIQANDYGTYGNCAIEDIPAPYNLAKSYISNDSNDVGIVMGHVRTGTGGRGSHPFQIVYDTDGDGIDETYMFQHNGNVGTLKQSFYNRILQLNSGWFTDNESNWEGSQNSITGWIDSELYFHFIVAYIEENDGDVIQGINDALNYAGIINSYYSANFILSDGNNIYAYRRTNQSGNTYNLEYVEYNEFWSLKTQNHSGTDLSPNNLAILTPYGDIETIDLDDVDLPDFKSGVIAQSDTWNSEVLITDNITVPSGVILNIDTEVNFAQDITFTVYGTVNLLDDSNFILNHASEVLVENDGILFLDWGSAITGSTPTTYEATPPGYPVGGEPLIPGDRIIAKNGGIITTGFQNPGAEITISSSSGIQWDGIFIQNPDDEANYWFVNCDISGIRKLSIENIGETEDIANLKLYRTDFHDAGQVVVRDGHNLSVEGIATDLCYFQNTPAYPIIAYESPVDLDYVHIEDNGGGIYLYEASSTTSTIKNCKINFNNGDGVKPNGVTFSEFSNNDIEENTGFGMLCYDGTLFDADQFTNLLIRNNGFAEYAGWQSTFGMSNSTANITITDNNYGSGSDYYLLMNLKWDQVNAVDIRGTNITSVDHLFPTNSNAWTFSGGITGSKELLNSAALDFTNQNYDSAQQTLYQLLSEYLYSKEAVSAVYYLYHIENLSTEDFAGLRDYLIALNVDEETHIYDTIKKVSAKTLMKEKDYVAAIDILETIIINSELPDEVISAMIDEGYCYLKLSESGDRALPENCTVKTTTLDEYQARVREMEIQYTFYPEEQDQNTTPVSGNIVMHSNHPNPFNPSTTISFDLAQASNVSVIVYNIKGQKVRTLLNEYRENGTHSVYWNGTDNSNNSVASGLYFYKLTSGKDTVTHKMLLLK